MIIINALRDFADGLARGLSLYFTERNDHMIHSILPGPVRRK